MTWSRRGTVGISGHVAECAPLGIGAATRGCEAAVGPAAHVVPASRPAALLHGPHAAPLAQRVATERRPSGGPPTLKPGGSCEQSRTRRAPVAQWTSSIGLRNRVSGVRIPPPGAPLPHHRDRRGAISFAVGASDSLLAAVPQALLPVGRVTVLARDASAGVMVAGRDPGRRRPTLGTYLVGTSLRARPRDDPRAGSGGHRPGSRRVLRRYSLAGSIRCAESLGMRSIVTRDWRPSLDRLASAGHGQEDASRGDARVPDGR